MSQISVTLVRADTNQEFDVELPDDAGISELLPALVKELGLPLTGPDGNQVAYEISNKRTGTEYKETATLGSAGTKTGDVLLLTSTFVAGSARKRARLKKDHEAILKLAADPDSPVEVECFGNPPRYYKFKTSLKGFKSRTETTENHEFEVKLGSFYPASAPDITWLTEIWHPNISGQAVCHSSQWSPVWTLADFIYEIGEMIRMKKFNPNSPLNGSAASWSRKGQSKFPSDERTLRAPETVEAEPKMKISISSKS